MVILELLVGRPKGDPGNLATIYPANGTQLTFKLERVTTLSLLISPIKGGVSFTAS